MRFLDDLRARLLPITRKATVRRVSLRPNGQPQASVEMENGTSVLILTPEKLTKGSEVKVKLATNGWTLA